MLSVSSKDEQPIPLDLVDENVSQVEEMEVPERKDEESEGESMSYHSGEDHYCIMKDHYKGEIKELRGMVLAFEEENNKLILEKMQKTLKLLIKRTKREFILKLFFAGYVKELEKKMRIKAILNETKRKETQAIGKIFNKWRFGERKYDAKMFKMNKFDIFIENTGNNSKSLDSSETKFSFISQDVHSLFFESCSKIAKKLEKSVVPNFWNKIKGNEEIEKNDSLGKSFCLIRRGRVRCNQ